MDLDFSAIMATEPRLRVDILGAGAMKAEAAPSMQAVCVCVCIGVGVWIRRWMDRRGVVYVCVYS